MSNKQERRGKGLCDYCEEPVKMGRFVCVKHAREKSEDVKARQRARVEAGLCRYCDSAPLPGITTCKKHARASSASWKKVSAERKTVGLCVRCNEPRVEGRSLCPKHIEVADGHERKRQPGRKAQRAERRAKGFCSYCATPAEQGRALCQKHAEYFKSVEHSESRKRYKKGKGKFSRARGAAVARFGADHWQINREQYEALVAEPCHYCSFPHDRGGVGLDRLDNEKGYLLDNVVSCCYECNVARSDHFTYEEMKNVLGPAIRSVKRRRLGLDQPEPGALEDVLHFYPAVPS